MKKLLLFDLDGTLLLTHGAGVRCMQRAGQRIWGEQFSLDGIAFGGGLDPLILAEALQNLGLELDPTLHERFQVVYEAELRGEFAQNPTVQVLPGIAALLEQARDHERSILGLLTGNYAPTGIAKLAAANIDPDWFRVKIWGDDGPTRPDLVRVAMERGGNIAPEHVVVIGDTPRDVDCAHKNGCSCVAVATGGYSRAELEQAGADIVFDDLSDHAALWAFIHG
ncbi:MAG TPA: HAD family hydrolase [Polyangiaceae bacterium]|nr:HAD family hydrolase [Polyangiaceae bacterium]